MKVLDLFSGTGGWSQAFSGRDEVFTIDNDPRFGADACIDAGDTVEVLRVLPWVPDVFLASPPCNAFSTGSMGKMWLHGHASRPKHPVAEEGMRLVLATVRLIAILRPRWYAIENPRGRLRSLDLLDGFPRHEVWQCRLGRPIAKPTDIWTNIPIDTTGLRCHNGHPDHIRAPRGSRTGTQGGLTTIESGSLPFDLSYLVREAILKETA